MTANGRKYGDRPSHPIYVWNGVLEAKHRKRIGEAIWEFLWCLDRITQERDGVGLVLGGKPVKCEDVAEGFGVSERTTRRHFDILEREGYIERTLTPYGYTIRVRNSRKFRVKEVGQECPTSNRTGRTNLSDLTGQECPTSPDKSVRPNKEKAVEEASEEAAAANPPDSVWSFLRISPCGPASFRALLGSRWDSRSAQRPSVVIGETVDAWEAAEGKKLRAPQLFRALAELRQREQREGAGHATVEQAQPIRVLTPEEIPA